MAKIERLPSGSYRTRVYVGTDADGKKIRKSITAKDKVTLRRLIVQYEEVKDAPAAPLLTEAIEAYIASREAVLAPYTIRGYKGILRALEGFSCVSLPCDSSSPAFQRIITEAILAGKKPKTVKNYAGLITAAVKYAGYPAPALTLPARPKISTYLPDEDDIRKLLQATAGTDLDIPVRLGIMGLRRGEVCAVLASDLEGDLLHISRAAVEIDGKVSTKAPKTYESDRVIMLPSDLAGSIKKAGRATKLSPSKLSDRFTLLLKREELPHFRFHDLRHFFVSYCHNILRLSDAQIQKLGGWNTDYVMKRHYLASMQDEEAQKKAAVGIEKLSKVATKVDTKS